MAALVAVPGRSYLQQRGEVAAADARLQRIEQENERMQRRQGPPGRCRARSSASPAVTTAWSSVGEESYTILPPATAGLVLPDAWPFDRLAGALAARRRRLVTAALPYVASFGP